MEVEAILGFVLLVCFVLALFIVLTARIQAQGGTELKGKKKPKN